MAYLDKSNFAGLNDYVLQHPYCSFAPKAGEVPDVPVTSLRKDGRLGQSYDYDNGWLAVGEPRRSCDGDMLNSIYESGGVHLYTYAAGVFTASQIIFPPVRVKDARFGTHISIEGDWLAIRSDEEVLQTKGTVYVYKNITGTWTWQKTIDLTTDGTVNSSSMFFGSDELTIKNSVLIIGAYSDVSGDAYAHYADNIYIGFDANYFRIYADSVGTMTYIETVESMPNGRGTLPDTVRGSRLSFDGTNMVMYNQHVMEVEASYTSPSENFSYRGWKFFTWNGTTFTEQSSVEFDVHTLYDYGTIYDSDIRTAVSFPNTANQGFARWIYYKNANVRFHSENLYVNGRDVGTYDILGVHPSLANYTGTTASINKSGSTWSFNAMEFNTTTKVRQDNTTFLQSTQLPAFDYYYNMPYSELGSDILTSTFIAQVDIPYIDHGTTPPEDFGTIPTKSVFVEVTINAGAFDANITGASDYTFISDDPYLTSNFTSTLPDPDTGNQRVISVIPNNSTDIYMMIDSDTMITGSPAAATDSTGGSPTGGAGALAVYKKVGGYWVYSSKLTEDRDTVQEGTAVQLFGVELVQHTSNYFGSKYFWANSNFGIDPDKVLYEYIESTGIRVQDSADKFNPAERLGTTDIDMKPSNYHNTTDSYVSAEPDGVSTNGIFINMVQYKTDTVGMYLNRYKRFHMFKDVNDTGYLASDFLTDYDETIDFELDITYTGSVTVYPLGGIILVYWHTGTLTEGRVSVLEWNNTTFTYEFQSTFELTLYTSQIITGALYFEQNDVIMFSTPYDDLVYPEAGGITGNGLLVTFKKSVGGVWQVADYKTGLNNDTDRQRYSYIKKETEDSLIVHAVHNSAYQPSDIRLSSIFSVDSAGLMTYDETINIPADVITNATSITGTVFEDSYAVSDDGQYVAVTKADNWDWTGSVSSSYAHWKVYVYQKDTGTYVFRTILRDGENNTTQTYDNAETDPDYVPVFGGDLGFVQDGANYQLMCFNQAGAKDGTPDGIRDSARLCLFSLTDSPFSYAANGFIKGYVKNYSDGEINNLVHLEVLYNLDGGEYTITKDGKHVIAFYSDNTKYDMYFFKINPDVHTATFESRILQQEINSLFPEATSSLTENKKYFITNASLFTNGAHEDGEMFTENRITSQLFHANDDTGICDVWVTDHWEIHGPWYGNEANISIVMDGYRDIMIACKSFTNSDHRVYIHRYENGEWVEKQIIERPYATYPQETDYEEDLLDFGYWRNRVYYEEAGILIMSHEAGGASATIPAETIIYKWNDSTSVFDLIETRAEGFLLAGFDNYLEINDVMYNIDLDTAAVTLDTYWDNTNQGGEGQNASNALAINADQIIINSNYVYANTEQAFPVVSNGWYSKDKEIMLATARAGANRFVLKLAFSNNFLVGAT